MKRVKRLIWGCSILVLSFCSAKTESRYCVEIEKYPFICQDLRTLRSINGNIKSLEQFMLNYDDMKAKKISYSEAGYSGSYWEFNKNTISHTIYRLNKNLTSLDYEDKISIFTFSPTTFTSTLITDSKESKTDVKNYYSDSDNKSLYYLNKSNKETGAAFEFIDNGINYWHLYKRFIQKKNPSGHIDFSSNRLEIITFNVDGNLSSRVLFIDGIRMEDEDWQYIYKYTVKEGDGFIEVYDKSGTLVRKSALKRILDDHNNIVYEEITRPDGGGMIFEIKYKYW